MSRLQNILNKADRDGLAHRVRVDLDAHPAKPAAAGPRDGSTRPAYTSRSESRRPLGAAVAPEPAAVQVVTGARLDRQFVAVSANEPAAEQYRALRTRILHSDSLSAVNVLLITSPGRAEGKTLTAGNLALTMAQEHQRHICLVEADLRHPRLQRLFGLPDTPGQIGRAHV